MKTRLLLLIGALIVVGAVAVALRPMWMGPPPAAAFNPALIAHNLPSAPQTPTLTLTGFAKTNGTDADGTSTTALSMRDLDALSQHRIAVQTEWFDDIAQFEGPLLRDVVALAGGTGADLRMTALNDYSTVIPNSDMLRYDVILATRLNGAPMSPRDWGPLWVAYPADAHPELRNDPLIKERWVWQLHKIETVETP